MRCEHCYKEIKGIGISVPTRNGGNSYYSFFHKSAQECATAESENKIRLHLEEKQLKEIS